MKTQKIDLAVALELRAAGKTFDEIATHLGITRGRAYWAVSRELKRTQHKELTPFDLIWNEADVEAATRDGQ